MNLALLLFVGVLVLLMSQASCVERRPDYVDKSIYSVSTITFVPDSLRLKQAEWITETMRAASNRLTTSDYEDPEDVLQQAQYTSEEIFGRKVSCLRISHDTGDHEYVIQERMTPEQRIIYDRLVNQEQESSVR